MKNTKVLCPGCGKPMGCSIPHLYADETPESMRYICGYWCGDYKCGWKAPNGNGKTPEAAYKNAYERAIRRADND